MVDARIRRNFHQANWDEPIIFAMSRKGHRGILLPEPEEEVKQRAGSLETLLPEKMIRKDPPKLPELSQKQVLSHYLHLSQETLGGNLINDIGHGTCTMKYNPRVNEDLASLPDMTHLHPLQDEETIQGILEIYYSLGEIMKEISLMDEVSFQASGGTLAVYAASSMIRSYFIDQGEERDEVITTIFSHPCNAAAPDLAGYKVITLYPGEDGLPSLDALKAALSHRTAALFITNPEDIGLYNPRIKEMVEMVHRVGGLTFYDQANANALLGIARAREVGFDICHFNLHKTFGTPHGSGGPGNAALCCTQDLAPYLPLPLVEFDGQKYSLNYDGPKSIGKVRDFFGAAGVVLRAYAWIMMLGAQGLREVAEISLINNNYLFAKLKEEIRELTYAYPENTSLRQEQVRYSLQKIKEDTGVFTEDIARRMSDYGTSPYFTSHHPWVIPEPMTLEPCETYSKDDLDEYIAMLKEVIKEAYEDQELVKTSPHKTAAHQLSHREDLEDPAKWAMTWRAYLRKRR